MNQQAEIKPLSTKPPELLPSDQSVDQPDTQNVPQCSTPAELQPAASAAPAVPSFLVVTGGNQASQHIQPQVVIRYGDGQEEIIDINNVESVRRVAKAGQVIRPQGSLSASYPQTSKHHDLLTSSLPVALQPSVPYNEDEDSTPNAPAAVPQHDASHVPPISAPPQDDNQASSSAQPSKKKDKKETEKYHSYSAPVVSKAPEQPADAAALTSTPALG